MSFVKNPTSCAKLAANTALRIQNKMISMMKEAEDMKDIGPVLEKQQKIINDCVDKKLSLSRLQSSIWEKTTNTQESFTLSDMDEDLMEKLMDKDSEITDKTNYRM